MSQVICEIQKSEDLIRWKKFFEADGWTEIHVSINHRGHFLLLGERMAKPPANKLKSKRSSKPL